MRPRKRVALLDGNEISWRWRGFAMEVWGYRVVAARTARELAKANGVDVVVTMLAGPTTRAKLERLRNGRELPWLSVGTLGVAETTAEAALALGASMRELRASLRILAARKRGPKKSIPR